MVPLFALRGLVLSAATEISPEGVLEQLRGDFPFYAANCLQIVDKQGKRIPFALNDGQGALERKLEAQRLAGKPQRAVILKARQEGFSTYAQGKMIHRATLNANHSAIVVAHDLETGAKLYRIGRTMYGHLPDDEALRPPVSSFKRSRYMHFGNPAEAWKHGDMGLDSEYLVSTAGETESGRGGTYRSAHLSELAFWPDIEAKLTALLAAVPDDPDTLVIVECTANGYNAFKDLWDDSEAGRNDFLPFFWPWWKCEDYTLPFLNASEREAFRVGDTDQSPYAEREPLLIDPGPIDYETGEHTPLSLERLNWRRWAIANRCGGKINKFDQEFPTEPDDAFLFSGSYVFEPVHARKILRTTKDYTPRLGVVEATERKVQAGRFGRVEVPKGPRWKPVERLLPGIAPDWKLWLDLEEDEKTKQLRPPADGCYVCGVDVSGGINESGEGEAAYHAIEVIDHETKRQVAEYSSRCDPDQLAEFVFLTAMFFNEAWLAIEITGGWGLPIARTIVQDWRYRFAYHRKSHERREDHQQDRLGWNTDRATKPILLALGQELIRGENHGIRSPDLCREMLTYVRTDTGKTQPERGKFSDRLMAWLIAQQVAQELPVRKRKGKRPGRAFRPRNPITGY